jgi:hypothetical protein
VYARSQSIHVKTEIVMRDFYACNSRALRLNLENKIETSGA